jgi:vacuolar-type H+-ATPase subunit I/STV1
MSRMTNAKEKDVDQDDSQMKDKNVEEEHEHEHHNHEEDAWENKTWKQKIIIRTSSKWKPIFDIFILIFVGYSCITTLYYIAFDEPNNTLH